MSTQEVPNERWRKSLSSNSLTHQTSTPILGKKQLSTKRFKPHETTRYLVRLPSLLVNLKYLIYNAGSKKFAIRQSSDWQNFKKKFFMIFCLNVCNNITLRVFAECNTYIKNNVRIVIKAKFLYFFKYPFKKL